MSSFAPRHAILNGQQNAAKIWSRNIAPNATANACSGPNAILATYKKKEG
jgi:hypothetical protein